LPHHPDDFETPRIAAKFAQAAPAMARPLSIRPESPSRAIPSGATLARDGAFYVGRLNERCAEFQKKARCGLEKRRERYGDTGEVNARKTHSMKFQIDAASVAITPDLS
jgi:hypothetical protein